MQDTTQKPFTDNPDATTQDPGIHEPGMDAMSASAGNPASDAGGEPVTNADDTDDEEEE
jgi:hypothetical protein